MRAAIAPIVQRNANGRTSEREARRNGANLNLGGRVSDRGESAGLGGTTVTR